MTDVDTIERVLRDAAKGLARLDKARLELRAAEDAMRGICRRYDLVTGCRGIRPEGVRWAITSRAERILAKGCVKPYG